MRFRTRERIRGLTTIIIDANLALALSVPIAYSSQASERIEGWVQENVRLAAPSLWTYEVASGLRNAVAAGVLTLEEAEKGLAEMAALEIQPIEPTLARNRRAIHWAERLGQTVAYEGQYLVVAEELEAQFWTADQRLSERARSAGATWVNWIGLGS